MFGSVSRQEVEHALQQQKLELTRSFEEELRKLRDEMTTRINRQTAVRPDIYQLSGTTISLEDLLVRIIAQVNILIQEQAKTAVQSMDMNLLAQGIDLQELARNLETVAKQHMENPEVFERVITETVDRLVEYDALIDVDTLAERIAEPIINRVITPEFSQSVIEKVSSEMIDGDWITLGNIEEEVTERVAEALTDRIQVTFPR